MEIAERYRDYSPGLLIEMLSMPKELEEKVTPDMTIRQVRGIKKQDKQKKDPIPEAAEVIIDGEYREVEEKKKEMVATSQFLEKGDSKPRKCITGMSESGFCACCGVDGIQCCAQCERSCNGRCGWIPERSDKQITPDDELTKLRRLLEKKKNELQECVEIDAVDPLPEGYIWERKVVVGALAGMLCDLEDVEEQSKQEPEQLEIPLLKNNDQRKEWLANYRNWGLWYRDEHIDVNYYKFDFRDGSRLVVAEYPQRHCYWKKDKEDQHYYHLLEKGRKGYGDVCLLYTSETFVEYKSYAKPQQDELKDVGGFVGGTLLNGKRKNESAGVRYLVTLDADTIEPGGTQRIINRVSALGCTYVIYSTRKHEGAAPRLRIIVPLDRECGSEEYEAIARKLAEFIDINIFDPTTFEPVRLMYWPSCSKDSEFVFFYEDKPFLSKDGMLSLYGNWQNIEEWPQVPGAVKLRERSAKKQGDPLSKSGIVGAFCKNYSIEEAMTEFIPGTYEMCIRDRHCSDHKGRCKGC